MNQYLFCSLALPAILFSMAGHAALPTPQSGSGLLLMPTAESLSDGDQYIGLALDHRSYIVQGSSANNAEVQFTPSYLRGVTDQFELGIAANLAQDVSAKNGALRNVTANGKYQFTAPGNGNIGIALSAYGALYTADLSDNIGSGDATSGGDLIFSWTTKDAGYHLALGGGKTDVKTTSPSISYFSDSYSSVSMGIDIRPIQNLAISVELNANRKNDLTNFLLMPGLKFASNNNTVYSLGLGYGIPDNRAEPEFRIMAGVSFGLGEKSRTTLDTQLLSLEQQLEAAQNRIAALESGPEIAMSDETQQALNALERRVDALASLQLQPDGDTGAASALRVEIINTSGIIGLGSILAENLSRGNYRVTRLISDGEPRRKTTHIYYREGLSRFAIALGHALPGDQVISQRYNVPASADLLIFIGTDLKSMAGK